MTLGRVLRRITPLFSKNISSPKIFPREIPKNIIGSILRPNAFLPLVNKYDQKRWFSNSQPEAIELDNVTYERVCSETLESLCDYFEELVEDTDHLKSADVSYGSGVLTIKLGGQHGTYVINRQSPNKQIWLSSPTSGPKRYDFVIHELPDKGKWLYKHTGESLHELLQREIGVIVEKDVDFFKLPYSKI